MATYYCGLGGNNGNDGLSWANRKLTLNGIEDIPVAAADIVYVAPGVYRETLTVDVSGSDGLPIVYIADVTGEHTDGIGGIVRITGSDNDQTITRSWGIIASSKNYRTFRGFMIDTASTPVSCTDCQNWIIEDCTGYGMGGNSVITMSGSGTLNMIVRRCFIFCNFSSGIYFTHSSTVDNVNCLVENCILIGGSSIINNQRIGGVIVKNCVVYGGTNGIIIAADLSAGQYMYVYNCLIGGCTFGLRQSNPSYQMIEDYNNIYGVQDARNNISTGTSSTSYPHLFWPQFLVSSFLLPQQPIFSLSPWSQMRATFGTGTSDDLFGITRPVTESKRSWGAVQFVDASRSTGTSREGSYSFELADAGRSQFIVPSTSVTGTVSVYAYREADYAGTYPQMIIKQPGQSDRTTTDTGGALSWNQLSDTFAPASSPSYFIVELVSNNTAISGNYAVYFDVLEIT